MLDADMESLPNYTKDYERSFLARSWLLCLGRTRALRLHHISVLGVMTMMLHRYPPCPLKTPKELLWMTPAHIEVYLDTGMRVLDQKPPIGPQELRARREEKR